MSLASKDNSRPFSPVHTVSGQFLTGQSLTRLNFASEHGTQNWHALLNAVNKTDIYNIWNADLKNITGQFTFCVWEERNGLYRWLKKKYYGNIVSFLDTT